MFKIKFDLHVHSCFSDGDLSVEELVSLFRSSDLDGIAIADHDNVDAYKYIEEKEDKFTEYFNILPAIEISSRYKEEEVHILGLDIDYNSSLIGDYCKEARDMRVKRFIRIVEAFESDGYSLNLDIEEIKKSKLSLGLPHIAKALVDEAYVSNVNEAFDKYLYRGSPYRIDKDVINLEEAITLIGRTGGIAVLAHPGLIKDKNIIGEILSLVDGVEVYHPKNSFDLSMALKDYAKSNGKFISGGSDFHSIDRDGSKIANYYSFVDYRKTERMISLGRKEK